VFDGVISLPSPGLLLPSPSTPSKPISSIVSGGNTPPEAFLINFGIFIGGGTGDLGLTFHIRK